MKNKKDIATAILYRIVGIGLKQGVNIIIFFIAAKLLIPVDFGLYNYLLAFALAFAVLGDFGISTATSKYVAKKSALGSLTQNNIAGSAFLVVVLASCFLSGAFIFAHSYIDIDFQYLVLLIALVYLIPIFSVFDGLYRGMLDNKALAIATFAGAAVSLPASVFLITSYGIWGAFLSQVIFYVVCVLVFALRYQYAIFRIDKQTIKQLIQISIPLGIIGLVYLTYARLDTILLGSFGYIVEVGYYEIVNKVILLLSLPIQIYAQVMSPRMVGLWHREKEKVFSIVRRHILYSIPILSLSALASYIVVDYVLQKYLTEYANLLVLTMLGWILFAFIFQGVSDLIGNTFAVATDHEKLNLAILSVFGLLNLVFVYLGIQFFGPVGVVYAKVAVYIPYTIVFLLLYLRAVKGGLPRIDVNSTEARS